MKLKSLDIGRLTIKNNLLLAPLAGFSDFAFRSVCLSLGAGLCFSEMVSAKGLTYNNENTKELLKTAPCEDVKAVQLFGSEPEIMEAACNHSALGKFDIVDINMGCPVPKVFNNGEGSALLENPDLTGRIVEACVKSGKVITVKIRLGVKRGENRAVEIAKACQQGGASMITVHGRYREDYYGGEVDYDSIAKVVESVKIPVIANGNIFSKEDAETVMEKTGAAGLMLARGALNKPWLFSEIAGKTVHDKKSVVKRHIDLLLEEYPDEYVAINMRKQMAQYLLGVKDAKKYKARAFQATTTRELKSIIASLQL